MKNINFLYKVFVEFSTGIHVKNQRYYVGKITKMSVFLYFHDNPLPPPPKKINPY